MNLFKVFLLFTALAFSLPVFSQTKNFKYQANIKTVDSSGVYRIEISPDLVAKSRQSLSDIRIVDNTGKFIAYALSDKLLLNYHEHFFVFPEVVSSQGADSINSYITENRGLLNVSDLWIKLKKTEVSRTVNLSGSDNLKDWFAIKENIPLKEAEQSSATDYYQVLSFPNSDYHYFKIQLNGKNKTPVKILQFGINTTGITQPVFVVLPSNKFSKTDTDKISHILVKFDQLYQINKIHLNISLPKYYNRRVVVYDVKGSLVDQLIDTAISSNGSQDLFISAKTEQLRLDIFNEDDNALNVQSVNAFQLKQYLISYLEKGRTYKIYTGSNLLRKPVYDLSFLNNISFNQIAGISHSTVLNNPSYFNIGHPLKADYTMLLWVSIIIALALLSFLTVKMTKEIK